MLLPWGYAKVQLARQDADLLHVAHMPNWEGKSNRGGYWNPPPPHHTREKVNRRPNLAEVGG